MVPCLDVILRFAEVGWIAKGKAVVVGRHDAALKLFNALIPGLCQEKREVVWQ